MKIERTIEVTKEIDVCKSKISVPVYLKDEDIPRDFPFRRSLTVHGKPLDFWEVTIDHKSGKIVGWPETYLKVPFHIDMQVWDGGTYIHFDEDNEVIEKITDYVPDEFGRDNYFQITIHPDGSVDL